MVHHRVWQGRRTVPRRLAAGAILTHRDRADDLLAQPGHVDRSRLGLVYYLYWLARHGKGVQVAAVLGASRCWAS